MKNNKLSVIMAVVFLIIIVVGSTYAFFKGTDASDTDTPLRVTTGTTDSLIFNVDADITMVADMSNFTEGAGNREGISHATATLKANNKTNSATGNYYLYFDIKENELTYTTDDNTPELILQVSGPDGALGDGDIAGLNYVTVTDGKGESISGFDITEVQDLINIVSNKSITTTSEKVDDWEIKVILVNLSTDQSVNGGKKFNGELLIQKDKINLDGIIKSVNGNYNGEIWSYRDSISKVVFENEKTNHNNATKFFDISSLDSNPVMAYMEDNGDNTYTVYINSKGKIIANEDSSNLFNGFSKLEQVKGMENLDMSQIANMSNMFRGCSSLATLDVGDWNMSKVIDISGMFRDCTALTTLDVSNWDTSNIIDMNYLFYNCSVLTLLSVNSWNTSKVIDMSYMFGGCSGLTNLDVSKFDTSQVINMSAMFSKCENIQSLSVSEWNVSKVKNLSYLFSWCTKLTTLNLNSWNLASAENMDGCFEVCRSMTTLNISSWNVSKVSSMAFLFSGCSSLTTVNVNSWDVSNVKYAHHMFTNCTSLISLDLSNWKLSVDAFSQMFDCCSKLQTLDIRNWDFSKNIEIYFNMFSSVKSGIQIIVKDTVAKEFIQARLNDAKKSGTVIIA